MTRPMHEEKDLVGRLADLSLEVRDLRSALYGNPVARQLGISWLTLAFALWQMLFHPPSTILLFSLKESEAKELVYRLQGMHARLPSWLQARAVLRGSTEYWSLSNGSRAMAFSTKGGRSYTGTIAVVDEADFVPDLNEFLKAVKPTIDAGGKLFLVSTSDKTRPVTTFKNLFRAAGAGVGEYVRVFLPWQARPDRDDAWHARTQAEMFAQRGTHDDFFSEYPATPEEALAPEELDRRIPYSWVKEVLDEREPLEDAGLSIPGLTLYVKPVPERTYVIGADPAEGNPHSDDSAATVLDGQTWEEVAALTGKFEPSLFGRLLSQLGRHFNDADVLPERNNHGHALILELRQIGQLRILNGHDGRPGWLANVKGKPLMWDTAAKVIQDRETRIRSAETAGQIAGIEASSLSAPEGLHDDRAASFALALCALVHGHAGALPSHEISAFDPLLLIDGSDAW